MFARFDNNDDNNFNNNNYNISNKRGDLIISIYGTDSPLLPPLPVSKLQQISLRHKLSLVWRYRFNSAQLFRFFAPNTQCALVVALSEKSKYHLV